jgi:hypothetical protein
MDGITGVIARRCAVGTTLELLESEALKLSLADRSHLLGRLIASLDVDDELEGAWEREADRRESELAAGRARVVLGSEVIERLRLRLA